MTGGLTDLTHMARLEPPSWGVARPSNREFWGRHSDDTTNRAMGEGRTDPPTNGAGNGRGTDGVGEDNVGDPPHN